MQGPAKETRPNGTTVTFTYQDGKEQGEATETRLDGTTINYLSTRPAARSSDIEVA